MNLIMEWLDKVFPGQKAFIIGLAMFLAGVAVSVGVEVPGVPADQAMNYISDGLAVIAVRLGIKKVEAKADA